jgi:TldD protein
MFSEQVILETLLSGGGIYADIFSERKEYSLIQMESQRIEKLEKGVDEGVGLRLITPWKTFLASTTSKDKDRLIELAKWVAQATIEAGTGARGDRGLVKARYPFQISVDPHDVDMQKKLDLVNRVELAARKMEPRIKQVKVVYGDTKKKVTIATSDGLSVEDERTQVVLNLLVVGEANNEMQTAYEAIGGFYGFEFFTEERMEQLIRTTVTRLSSLLEAIEAPMGMKTVVLSSEAGGTMVHEAIGHGLEADLAMEGLSCYKGLLGQEIASPLVSIVDDKTVPNLRGTYAYDDEGCPSERTVLVESGILRNYLFDRFHALKHGMASTANGRRESFRFRPIPRMSNTMILPGTDDPETILRSVDDGVLVKKMGGGQVDTVRGDFVFEISEGYLIRKGQIGPMIKNATMMGNGPKALKDIDMVGTDLGIGIGTCGKDGQGVPVADGQPTLRIHNIIVGGKGEI